MPASYLLGRENQGFEIIMSSMHLIDYTQCFKTRSILTQSCFLADFNHERLWLACTSLRLARCCIEDAYKYAQVRETFGKPLLANQVIRAKFSAGGRKVDSATALMEQLVFMEQARSTNGVSSGGGPGGREIYLGGQFANLKILCGQTLEFVSREMQQVMGGLGYSRGGRGARVEQISRDVRVMVVGGGSEEILTELSIAQEQRAMAKL